MTFRISLTYFLMMWIFSFCVAMEDTLTTGVPSHPLDNAQNEFTDDIQPALDRLKIDRSYLLNLCDQADVTPCGTISIPTDGFKGNNFVVFTEQHGPLIFRVHSLEQLHEVGDHIAFECEALRYLKEHDCPTLEILPFKNGNYYYEDEKAKVYYYPYIAGKSLLHCPMTEILANKVSHYLSLFRHKSSGFTSQLPTTHRRLLGPLKVFNMDILNWKTLRHVLSKQPDLNTDPSFQALLEEVRESNLPKRLEHLKMEIVHGDFAIGNLILNLQDEIRVIDFGMMHYGYPVMDLILSFMTIPCRSLGHWDIDLLGPFLSPQRAWLKENQIDFPLFCDLIKMNCFCFSVFTFHHGIHNTTPYNSESNPHMKRYIQLNEPNFFQKLTEIYHSENF